MLSLLQKLVQILLHNSNQFASGGLLLMLVGGIAASLRSIPMKMYRWLHHQCTISLEITEDSNAMQWFKWWIAENKYGQRSRHLDLFTPDRGSYVFNVAPGDHWFFFKGRPLWVHFKRSDEAKGNYQAKRSETITLSTLGRKQKRLRDIVESMYAVYLKNCTRKPMLYTCTSRDGDWFEVNGYRPRTLDSVVLPIQYKELMLQDMQNFFSDEDWYVDMGIPYHRGYLLHGLPGTGKTSLVQALGEHFKKPIYILKLADMSDDGLRNALQNVRDNALVLMEDVDCCSIGKRKLEQSPAELEQTRSDGPEIEVKSLFGITLSGFLNALDGLEAPHGVIYFMTTNAINKLDAALLRPGRIDVKMEFTHATHSQLVVLYKRFFPTDSVDVAEEYVTNDHQDYTMAEYQEKLLRERNRRKEVKLADVKYIDSKTGEWPADANSSPGTPGLRPYQKGTSGGR